MAPCLAAAAPPATQHMQHTQHTQPSNKTEAPCTVADPAVYATLPPQGLIGALPCTMVRCGTTCQASERLIWKDFPLNTCRLQVVCHGHTRTRLVVQSQHARLLQAALLFDRKQIITATEAGSTDKNLGSRRLRAKAERVKGDRNQHQVKGRGARGTVRAPVISANVSWRILKK